MVKVQLFWEGHKNVRKRPYGFEIYLVNVKTRRTIVQIVVAFSEKLNFTQGHHGELKPGKAATVYEFLIFVKDVLWQKKSM